MKVEEDSVNERYSMRERRKPSVFSPQHPPSKHPDSDLKLHYSVIHKKGFKESRGSGEIGLKSAWKLNHILAKLSKALSLSSHSKYSVIYFDPAAQSKY